MIEIGKMNKLIVTKATSDEIHFDGDESGDIVIPTKDTPELYQKGDEVSVFVYQDQKKGLCATTQQPFATVGDFAVLQVVSNSNSGSFLNWGMPKDLLVSKKEQYLKMEEGNSYVVYLFLDKKSKRVTASSKLDQFLSQEPPEYEENEKVDLLICDQSKLGYKVIVNLSHWGMIYKNKVYQELQIGQELSGFIKSVRDDHKIDISLQQSGYKRVDNTSQRILKVIKELGEEISVTEKSSPEDIQAQFGVSKKTFKKAIGNLYKKRLITMRNHKIQIATDKREQKS